MNIGGEPEPERAEEGVKVHGARIIRVIGLKELSE